MKVPIQRYSIGRYVTLWRSDGANHKGELLIKDGQLRGNKITTGKELVVYVVGDFGQEERSINLGPVIQGRNYRKGESVELLSNSNWYVVEFNRSLATLLEDFGAQSEIFDNE